MGAVSIITPSYAGDFDRCRLLCDSVDSFVSGKWHHYIIVEDQDLELFRPLTSPRRTILRIKEVLPDWLHKVGIIPFSNRRSLWFSFKTGWMVGWHIQQLVKIQMAIFTKDDALLYCDSDVFFIKPFDVAGLWFGSKLRFFRSGVIQSAGSISFPKYLVNASEVLGLGKNPFPSATYVNNLVSWHAPTVRAMCKQIEDISGRSWIAVLGKRLVLSEYSLYGLYVDRVEKDNETVMPISTSLCKTAWNRGDWSDQNLLEFCDTLEPQHIALGFQSFLGVKVSSLRKQFDRAVAKTNSTTEPQL